VGLNSKSKKSVEKSGKKKPKKTKDKTKERQDKTKTQNKTKQKKNDFRPSTRGTGFKSILREHGTKNTLRFNFKEERGL